VAPALKQLAVQSTDYRVKLHALWTLDGIGEIDAPTVQAALADKSPEVRASAVRLSERWLREASHPLQAAVIKLSSDATWTVRRQAAASLGELPAASRVAPLAEVLKRYRDDQVTVDAAISGLAGLEAQVLDSILQKSTRDPGETVAVSSHPSTGHITMLAAAISRGRDAAAVGKLIALATEPNDPARSMALLRGIDIGLEGGGTGRGGGRGGRGAGGGALLALPEEPIALVNLKEPTNPPWLQTKDNVNGVIPVARRVLARLTWPGKAAPVVVVTPLTAAEQKRFEQGREVYNNLCVACHQPDGQGREKIAPSLVNSRYVSADPGVATRIVLAGKEGPIGLMPPLGASLSDEQIAAVLTFIRREWGHTASAVAPADVKEIRGLTASRKRPWTEDEVSRLVGGRGGRGGRGGQ
jgi:mono/diheme cytochrome c family protein